ncbi:hypothetical protein C8R44DRAFT_886825 [Mycena epipterygia]|nr:hypothetical protein C8R44DRAFT_886825 [Mycena epipterygia]
MAMRAADPGPACDNAPAPRAPSLVGLNLCAPARYPSTRRTNDSGLRQSFARASRRKSAGASWPRWVDVVDGRRHRRSSYVGADDIPASRAWYPGTGPCAVQDALSAPCITSRLPTHYGSRRGVTADKIMVPSVQRAHIRQPAEAIHARTLGALEPCSRLALFQYYAAPAPVSGSGAVSPVLTPLTRMWICIHALLSAHIRPPSAFVIQYKSRSTNAVRRTDRERGLLDGSGYDAEKLGLGAVEAWEGLEGIWGGPLVALFSSPIFTALALAPEPCPPPAAEKSSIDLIPVVTAG